MGDVLHVLQAILIRGGAIQSEHMHSSVPLSSSGELDARLGLSSGTTQLWTKKGLVTPLAQLHWRRRAR